MTQDAWVSCLQGKGRVKWCVMRCLRLPFLFLVVLPIGLGADCLRLSDPTLADRLVESHKLGRTPQCFMSEVSVGSTSVLTWEVRVELIDAKGNKLVNKKLPLPIPASRKEAWKACERFLEETMKENKRLQEDTARKKAVSGKQR